MSLGIRIIIVEKHRLVKFCHFLGKFSSEGAMRAMAIYF